ncbi:hypothetical protein LJK88_13895 [Paenibacillus sp. P26]|nr:hypothetical protein LJK88_13895 [Paenibacillus sp. P26]
MDIAVKLYMLAQWGVIMHVEDNKERVTIGLLRNVASRHMQLVQPLLQVPKRNDPLTKLLVDDLFLFAIKGRINPIYFFKGFTKGMNIRKADTFGNEH